MQVKLELSTRIMLIQLSLYLVRGQKFKFSHENRL